MSNRVAGRIAVAVLVTCLAGPSAFAGSHLWRFNEIFSNEDGTVQFIELRECCGADRELFIEGKWIESEATGARFVFPEDLTGDTSRRHLLLATAAFVELPGSPTPDYIIPDGFFDPDADTLRYWMYSGATFTYESGDLPLDGILALQGDHTTEVNSPTNYEGDRGSVVASCHPADLNANGAVEFGDLIILMSKWGLCLRCPTDLNRDNTVDLADLLMLLAAWGPCE